jgi:hypothetical protein
MPLQHNGGEGIAHMKNGGDSTVRNREALLERLAKEFK